MLARRVRERNLEARGQAPHFTQSPTSLPLPSKVEPGRGVEHSLRTHRSAQTQLDQKKRQAAHLFPSPRK